MTDSSSKSDSANKVQTQPMLVAYQSDAEKTVDVREVVATLWRYKWLIVASTVVFAGMGVLYSVLKTPIYQAEAVLIPNQGEDASALPGNIGGLASLAGIDIGSSADSTESIAMLQSRVLAEELIVGGNLLPILFADDWNAERGEWIVDGDDDPPSILDGVMLLTEDVRSIREDPVTGIVTISIAWTDPVLAAAWADELIRRVNERLRSRDIATSERRLVYLREQLQRASLVELRQVMSRLIEGEIQTVTLAQADEEYAFKIIDPPRVPEEPVAPKPLLVIAGTAFLGGVLGVIIALLMAALRSNPATTETPSSTQQDTSPSVATTEATSSENRPPGKPRIVSSKH